jgi:hypothetical protein
MQVLLAVVHTRIHAAANDLQILLWLAMDGLLATDLSTE